MAPMVERRNYDLDIARQCVRHYFSANNDRLFAYIFTSGDPQLE